jgi:hypothetical protein
MRNLSFVTFASSVNLIMFVGIVRLFKSPTAESPDDL